MAAAVALHDALLRDVVVGSGDTVVKFQGDASSASSTTLTPRQEPPGGRRGTRAEPDREASGARELRCRDTPTSEKGPGQNAQDLVSEGGLELQR